MMDKEEIKRILSDGFDEDVMFEPVAYVSHVEEADFGCEGREDGSAVTDRISFYYLDDDELRSASVEVEESLINESGIEDDMWIAVDEESSEVIMMSDADSDPLPMNDEIYEIISEEMGR